MTNHRDALVPPPPQDEAPTRWTRPMIRELGRVQGTEGGSGGGVTESVEYYDFHASTS